MKLEPSECIPRCPSCGLVYNPYSRGWDRIPEDYGRGKYEDDLCWECRKDNEAEQDEVGPGMAS